MHPNPFYHMERAAEKSGSKVMAFVSSGLVIALGAVMLWKELKPLRGRNHDRDECSRHQR